MGTQSLEALLKAGEVEQARALAEETLRQNKEDRTALLALARLECLDGRLQEAEMLLRRATRDGREDADSLLVQAALAAQRDDVNAARAFYERIISETKPPRAEAFFGLGFLLASEEDWKGAREPLARAVELDPNVGQYRFHLARVLLVQEELQAALPHLEKALELDPTYPPTYLVWTEVMLELGEADKAEELLRKGLEVLPGDVLLRNALGNVLAARGDASGALALAQELVKEHPAEPGLLGNLARMLMATGNREEALALCRHMEEGGMVTAQSKSIEGMVLEGLEPPDVAGAVEAYEAAMKLDPEDWRAPNNLGNLLLSTDAGNPDENLAVAVDVLAEARRRAPSRPEPTLNLALAYARLGKKDEARAQASQALELMPESEADLRDQATRLLKALG